MSSSPKRPHNTLGLFLSATACLAEMDLVESSDDDLFVVEEGDDEDEKPQLADISMESDGSDGESPVKNITVSCKEEVPSLQDEELDGPEDYNETTPDNNDELPLNTSHAHFVRIPLENSSLYLDLLEYKVKEKYRGSSCSTVDNGGLGLLRYLRASDWPNVTLINIGAGTGLVGLGVAAASKGKAVVAVTETPQIMPLLEQNLQLNQALWDTSSENESSVPPEPHVLEWGKPISKKWLQQILKKGAIKSRKSAAKRTVIVTGADVIGRRSLAEPLLLTLYELIVRVREFTNRKSTRVECVFAFQSTGFHLDDFWEIARKNGFSVERIAIVELDSQDRLRYSKAKVQFLDIQHRQLPPVTQTKRSEGIVWIVRLRQMPYTFSI